MLKARLLTTPLGSTGQALIAEPLRAEASAMHQNPVTFTEIGMSQSTRVMGVKSRRDPEAVSTPQQRKLSVKTHSLAAVAV